MDFCAPLAPAQKSRAHQGLSGQLQMERTGCAGICGLRCAAPARQDGLEAAPAKMSLNNGKSTAPGVGGCNGMKCLTTMSCPAQAGKNAEDCQKITSCIFHGAKFGQQEVGISLYRHRASRNSLKTGFSHLAILNSLQSFCGLRHKHCRARVMAGGCVKYRMPGTK